ncbi:MAG: hypothetical protein WCY16_03925 [Weeksellaceae bacterium]
MNVKERLKSFADSVGLTVSALEKELNVSNGYINSISKSIGLDKLELLIEKFPNLNVEWLLTGKGSMVRRSNEDEALRLRITELEELNDLLRFKISVLEEAAERVKKEKKID